jgi:hypothetical protein
MSKGFGVKPPKKDDKLAQQLVRHCQQRCPEKLDRIFDALAMERTKAEHQDITYILINTAIVELKGDIESICWFCGYFARGIDRVENKEKHSFIEKLSQTLIESGMQPFSDFVPYPGWCIIIVNTKKFKTLPVDVQQAVQQLNQVSEKYVLQKRSSHKDINIPFL